MTRHILTIALFAGSLAACSMPEYRASVTKFGESAQTVAAHQSTRLAALTDRQQNAISEQLTSGRVSLGISPGCAALFAGGTVQAECAVVGPNGSPLPQPETFSEIEALNAAFFDYAKSLTTLAGSSNDDATAFNAALLELAASADGLQAALNKQPAPTEDAPRLNAVATIGGALSTAAFDAARSAKLRRIIADTDPLIQRAATQLSRASEALLTSEVGAAFATVETALAAHEASLQSNATSQVVAARQKAVFEAVAALRGSAAAKGSYAQAAQTHAALAQAAHSGLSSDDFKASVVELISLARLLRNTANTL